MAGMPCRMQKENFCRRLTPHKPVHSTNSSADASIEIVCGAHFILQCLTEPARKNNLSLPFTLLPDL
jgi:hypothetical protein